MAKKKKEIQKPQQVQVQEEREEEEIPFKYLTAEEIDNAVKKWKGLTKKEKGTQQFVIQLRNYVIYQYIAQGLTLMEINRQIQARWEIGYHGALNYIHHAMEELKPAFEEEKKNAFEIQANRITTILQSAIESNDNGTALRATEQLNKLYGLYSDKVEIASNQLVFKFGNLDVSRKNSTGEEEEETDS